MLNPFIIKKYGALLFNSLAAVITFYIGLLFYGFLGGLLFLFFGLIIGILVSNYLLKNPFTELVEGKGILALPFDSSGLISPFILKVNMPFVEGKYRGQEISDVFNRKTVLSMSSPLNLNKAPEVVNTGTEAEAEYKLRIDISEEEYNTGRFQLNQYPVFIYNMSLNSILTKEMLTTMENKAFAEHTILNLTRKVNELSKWIRDFARHAIEQMRPKSPMKIGTIAMWILIVLMGIMLIIFMPQIIKVLGGGAADSAGNSLANALGSAKTIVPR